MTLSADRSGGPNRDSAAVEHFLTTPGWFAVCGEDSSGALVALPAFLVSGKPERVVLATPETDLPPNSGNEVDVAIVADEFASYEGIRGVIAQGVVVSTDEHRLHIDVVRAKGFSFANTLPDELRDERQE